MVATYEGARRGARRVNNIQPVKISEKRRIDGMVSLLNAWVIYVRDYEDYMYLVG